MDDSEDLTDDRLNQSQTLPNSGQSSWLPVAAFFLVLLGMLACQSAIQINADARVEAPLPAPLPSPAKWWVLGLGLPATAAWAGGTLLGVFLCLRRGHKSWWAYAAVGLNLIGVGWFFAVA